MNKFIAASVLLFSAQLSYANLIVDNVYIPQAPPGSMTLAAYLNITNSGAESRTVVGISSPVFATTHLHHTMMKDGVSSMKSIEELVIEPGETITFEPGGLHIMLMKPLAASVTTDFVPITLVFKNGETLNVTATLRAIN